MTQVQETKDWLWKDVDWEKATPKSIEKVIKAGGDVNDIGWEGAVFWRDVKYKESTPLSLAVQAKNVPVVKYLLEHQADPNFILANRKYDYGDREIRDVHIFSKALETKNKKIIDLFFQHGVDPYSFDPTENPKIVLKDYRDGGYVNGPCTVGYLINWAYARHPLYTAIETNNLDVLKKITSAPYTVPEKWLESIRTRADIRGEEKTLPETEQFWEAFIAQREKEKRKGLRQKLAIAHKKGDRTEKLKALIRLRGDSKKDQDDITALIDENGDGFDEVMDLSMSERKKKEELEEKKMISTRDSEADEYKKLRRKYNSEIARMARKVVQEKRAKILGK